MSESYIGYSSAPPLTKEAFFNRPCTLTLSHPDFKRPTAEEVKALRNLLNLSQADLGRLAGKRVTSKGCSQVRKWETQEDNKEHRAIELGVWRVMLYAAGICNVDDDIKAATEK